MINTPKSPNGTPPFTSATTALPITSAEHERREAIWLSSKPFYLINVHILLWPREVSVASRAYYEVGSLGKRVTRVIELKADEETSGHAAHDLLRLGKVSSYMEFREFFPSHKLTDLTKYALGKVECQLPWRVTHLGKPLDFMALSWNQYMDLCVLYSHFCHKDWGPPTDENKKAPTFQHLPCQMPSTDLNPSIFKDFCTGMFKFMQKEGAKSETQIGLMNPAPLPWVGAHQLADRVQVVLLHTDNRLWTVLNRVPQTVWNVAREEDCPKTPDGAWLTYLDDLIALGVEERTEGESGESTERRLNAADVASAKKRERQQKFDQLPNVLEGVDAFSVLYQVAEHGGFLEKDFKGTPMVVDRLRDEAIGMEKGDEGEQVARPRAPSSGTTTAMALDTIVKGRLVFATQGVFKAMMQRRYAGRAMLRQLGKRPPYFLPDIHVLAPHEFGQVPGFVAGQHRYPRDRLCAVMITYDPALWDLNLRERKVLIESSKGPKLWVFPRQWLFDLTGGDYHWWDAGWFGTPFDPSLPDFTEPDAKSDN